MPIGYCCNVHSGTSLAEIKANLLKYGSEIMRRLAFESLNVGLWFSSTASSELKDRGHRKQFRRWLDEVGMVPFTLNGFPFGDFHQSIVKYDVYQPSWAEEDRLNYTLDLVNILNDLLPEGVSGTVSTLPLGWPGRVATSNDRAFLERCAMNLKKLVQYLDRFHQSTGRWVMVCLEPEPGCFLDSAEDLVRFFNEYLSGDRTVSDSVIRKYLGVCHDICHSAVMFEEQADAIELYNQSEILIGKVQVSSALEIDFDSLSSEEAFLAVDQLSHFAEPRYLHQSVWNREGKLSFFEDMPQALAALNRGQASQNSLFGKMRVHFHVPIFASELNLLSTTQREILKCMRVLEGKPAAFRHFEVETYAWNVLPEAWRAQSLSRGIAEELKWFHSQIRID
jgi:sugar phosphate isomerase/epimerase